MLCLFAHIFFRDFLFRSLITIKGGIEKTVDFVLPQSFRRNSILEEENKRLREEITNLIASNAIIPVLQKENQDLHFLFQKRKASTTEVLGTVVAYPSKTPFDELVVEITGETKVGDRVFVGGLVLGEVVEVISPYATVRLFSSPGNTFQGKIGDNKVDVRGLGGGAFEALVPIGMSIKVGDPLVLQSLSPKVFGVVMSVEEKESEGFKRLLFSLPVNLNMINYVVIKNN